MGRPLGSKNSTVKVISPNTENPDADNETLDEDEKKTHKSISVVVTLAMYQKLYNEAHAQNEDGTRIENKEPHSVGHVLRFNTAKQLGWPLDESFIGRDKVNRKWASDEERNAAYSEKAKNRNKVASTLRSALVKAQQNEETMKALNAMLSSLGLSQTDLDNI